MHRRFLRLAYVLLLAILVPSFANATTIRRLSFEELTDSSDAVVSGHITRSWATWDANRKYIWTHYELSVDSVPKGKVVSAVEFAEPGGALDGLVMSIAGSVAYRPGENVLVFLQRMPNGYLRTTGWGQGKYSVDRNGRLRASSALRQTDMADARTAASAATSLRTLDGMTLPDVAARIGLRVRHGGAGK